MVNSSLILTSTGRLARRIRTRLRHAGRAAGAPGWELPRLTTLNAWLGDAWADAWQETAPAPAIVRMHLWQEVVRTHPPPSSLRTDLALFRLLDETFSVLIRHRLDPVSGVPSTPLVEWRRAASTAFRGALAERALFHPAALPLLVADALSRHIIPCPEHITICGFESPAPIEEDLFTLLRSRTGVSTGAEPDCGPAIIEARALPSRDQEVKYLVSRLTEDAGAIPLHRIGIIVPDLDVYKAMLARDLDDVLGLPPPGHQWYNITRGVPLSETALYNSAVLPLRLALEGEPRELLTSLILSPYYGWSAGRRHELARADRILRADGIERDLARMFRHLRRKNAPLANELSTGVGAALSQFCSTCADGKRTLRQWIASLREIWHVLGFPVLSDEKDRVDMRHLEIILEDMDRHLGEIPMDGREWYAWLAHAAAEETVQIGTSEEAGIQIMGIIESRGIDFDKLYLIDMNDRSLPQPARPLPLLDSRERGHVLGGTSESQYRFASTVVARITHQAPHIVLLRAEQEGTTPLLPSPFWPSSHERVSLDLWNAPDAGWIRASWLHDAFHRIHRDVSRDNTRDAISDGPVDSPRVLPRVMSVGSIKTALTCPYLFFVSGVLGIEPLEETDSPVPPKERGSRLHRALAAFTRTLREHHIDPSSGEEVLAVLEKSVDEMLAGLGDNPFWMVERERWLDRDVSRAPGILRAWLSEEVAWRREGWCTVGEELPFDGLSMQEWPFSIRGRIDRIDRRADGAVHLWDYKSGRAPMPGTVTADFTEPQLPLYLFAFRAGLVAHAAPPDSLSTAGYMQLNSLKDMKRVTLNVSELHLTGWRRVIAALGALLADGTFPARPYAVSNMPAARAEEACMRCPYITLCERGLIAREYGDDSGEDQYS